MLLSLSIVSLSAVLAVAQAPAGWDQTSLRALELLTKNQSAQAIALLERAVAQAPGFEPAEYELANAHHHRAGELAIENPPQAALQRRHLEQAARLYQQVARRNGQYRQPALGFLLMVYDTDELDDPAQRAAVARQYVAIDPRSPMGHAALAAALRKTGQDAAAWSALDAACASVSPDEASTLARAILMHLTDALPYVTAETPAAAGPAAPKELARLLDYVDRAVDRELAADRSNRQAIVVKAAASTMRAQRLERDPARRRQLEDDAERLLARNRESSPRARPTTLDGPAAPPTGFAEAAVKADALAERKQYAEAMALYEPFIASHPSFAPPHYLRVGVLLRAGQSASIEPALRAARKAVPATYEGRYAGAAILEEVVRKHTGIAAADATRAMAEAVALLDEALMLTPGDPAALVYKSLAIRQQARVATDPAAAKALTAEADRLRAAAQDAQQKR